MGVGFYLLTSTMSLNDAKMPSLRDKLKEQEEAERERLEQLKAEAEAEVERAEEKEKGRIKRNKKGK